MLFKRSVSLSLSLVSSSFLFKLISRLIIVLFFLARSTKKIKDGKNNCWTREDIIEIGKHDKKGEKIEINK